MRRPMSVLAAGVLIICIFFVSGNEITPLWENGSSLYLEGRVKNKELLETSSGSVWQVTLQQVQSGGEEHNKKFCKGLYVCQLLPINGWEPEIGQKLWVKGNYTVWESASNPGQFDLGKWYRSQGIYGQFRQCQILQADQKFSFIGEILWEARNWGSQLLSEALGSEDGALISAMIFGEKSGLDSETKQLYQKNGISHILSISGVKTLLLA